jgi:hypothetical protein
LKGAPYVQVKTAKETGASEFYDGFSKAQIGPTLPGFGVRWNPGGPLSVGGFLSATLPSKSVNGIYRIER